METLPTDPFEIVEDQLISGGVGKVMGVTESAGGGDWVMQSSEWLLSHATFLDVNIRIDQVQFCTSINMKPTNHQQYLHYHSCNPISTKYSIP